MGQINLNYACTLNIREDNDKESHRIQTAEFQTFTQRYRLFTHTFKNLNDQEVSDKSVIFGKLTSESKESKSVNFRIFFSTDRP